MKLFKTVIVLLLFFLCASTVNGEVYIWIDENGTKHFSNTPPDIEGDDIEKINEVPYDEVADKKRSEIEKQIDQERARRLKAEEREAEKKAMILKRQQEVEQEQIEAKQREEAARKAEALAEGEKESAAKKARQRQAAESLKQK